MISKISILAITKNGLAIARRIRSFMPEAVIYAPSKFEDGNKDTKWYAEQTGQKIVELFTNNDVLVCIFSLGAVIRLLSPLIKDKRTDPAVLVIDDKANFIISTLSGHLGGANAMARQLANYLQSTAVITTAADVNETIAVDLVGREFGWEIENYENVTKVSALMVNEEKIAIYQDAGEENWWTGKLPSNTIIVGNISDILDDSFKAALIITDKIISDKKIREKSVIYVPKSLVVGIGLHRDTTLQTISTAINKVFEENQLNIKSIRNLSSVSREGTVKGLQEFSKKHNLTVQLYDKAQLSNISVPNPSDTVKKFEGTPSVSEASSILSSGGELIIQKLKFPPDVTIAVSRVVSK